MTTVFVFVDRNTELLELQLSSFRRFLKNSEVCIIDVCGQSVVAELCSKYGVSRIVYTGNKNVAFKYYYVEQLNWFARTIQPHVSGNILFMHADMFLINDFDPNAILTGADFCVNPQYRLEGGLIAYSYLWDGFCLWNNDFVRENDLLKLFDWGYIEGVSDVGGKTSKLFKAAGRKKFFDFVSISDLKGENLTCSYNGNLRFNLDINNCKITQEEYWPLSIEDGKNFPHQIPDPRYGENLSHLFLSIFSIANQYNFPIPYSFDIVFNTEDWNLLLAPVLHLKSGSWAPMYRDEAYKQNKLLAISTLINREIA